MWYHLILVLFLHHEFSCLFSYCQYAQMSSCQLQNNNIFPMLPSLNENSEQKSDPVP